MHLAQSHRYLKDSFNLKKFAFLAKLISQILTFELCRKVVSNKTLKSEGNF